MESGLCVAVSACIATGRRLASTRTGLRAIRQALFFLHFLLAQPTLQFSRWARATLSRLASSIPLCLRNLWTGTAVYRRAALYRWHRSQPIQPDYLYLCGERATRASRGSGGQRRATPGRRAVNVIDGSYVNQFPGTDVNRFAGDLVINKNVLTRLNPSFGSITYTTNIPGSEYNALILTGEKRLPAGARHYRIVYAIQLVGSWAAISQSK